MRLTSFLFSLLLSAGVCQVATGQLSPLTLGAIPPGDSLVVYYDVTINEGAGSQVVHQGTVFTLGFTLVTDDPDTGLPDDPTITPLNLFPLPVRLMSLAAVPEGPTVSVRWTVAAESDMSHYEIERSTDGRQFLQVGQVAAVNSLQEHLYVFRDPVPGGGAYYYRLKMIETGVPPRYSRIVRVDLEGRGAGITVFPNPATTKKFTLQVNNIPKGTYRLDIYNQAGQPVYHQQIAHEGGSSNRSLSLPAALVRGLYFVRFSNGKVMYMQPLLLVE